MNIKRKIFEFIIDHHNRWNQPLSIAAVRQFYDHLCEDVDLHLQQLEREGLLNLDHGQGNVTPTPAFTAASCIQVLGNTLSQPLEPDVRATLGHSVVLDLSMLGIQGEKNLHGFFITDESMTDAGFCPGDFVVIKEGGFTQGDLVAVRVDQHLVLRRCLALSGIPHFLAENSLRPDLRLALEVPVYGIFWGLIRIGTMARDDAIQQTQPVNYLAHGGLELRRTPKKPPVTEAPPSLPRPGTAAAGASQKRVQQKKVCTRGANKETVKKKVTCNWPAAPSGVQLNDRNRFANRIQSAQFEDELPDQPYAADHFNAVARFCKKRDQRKKPVGARVAVRWIPCPLR